MSITKAPELNSQSDRAPNARGPPRDIPRPVQPGGIQDASPSGTTTRPTTRAKAARASAHKRRDASINVAQVRHPRAHRHRVDLVCPVSVTSVDWSQLAMTDAAVLVTGRRHTPEILLGVRHGRHASAAHP